MTALRFEINNDLNRLVFSFHNKIHFWGAMALSACFGFRVGYGLAFLWEVGDGFKPWYDDPRYKSWYGPGVMNYLKRELLLSDKFSLQDALVWDLGGALIGVAIRLLLVEGFQIWNG